MTLVQKKARIRYNSKSILCMCVILCVMCNDDLCCEPKKNPPSTLQLRVIANFGIRIGEIEEQMK